MLKMKDNYKSRALHTLGATLKSISKLKSLLGSDFNKAIVILKNRSGNIIVTGVGKSGFIAQKISATLTSLGNRSFYLNPTDALHGDSGIVREGDIVIAISFSGESNEVFKVLKHLKETFSTQIISITGNRKSKIGKISDVSLCSVVEKEGDPLNLAPMASTTTSLVIGDMLASALTEPKSFKKHNFAKFHPHGSLGLSLKKISEVMVKGKELPTIREDKSFKLALKVMTEGKRGVVGVLNSNNKIVGVITDGDVRRIIIANDSPGNLQVKSVMTKNPKIINKDSSLKEALELMDKMKITSLFVADKSKRLEGLLHIRHILSSIN